MILSPRYDGPPIITVDGAPNDVLAPLVRQRRRFEATLADLAPGDWQEPSRCDGWTVQDVVAHLVGVNAFWEGSVRAGLAGSPTRILGGFDPAATPKLMVDPMRSMDPGAVRDQFSSSNAGFLDAVADLDDAGLATIAESPAGHVSISLLCAHALWDSWVHERDVVLPLGASPAIEDDEVGVSLRYAAALSPALGFGTGTCRPGRYEVAATDPALVFALDVTDRVEVHELDGASGAPCLRGTAAGLTEALSMREPLPAATPDEWRQVLGGIATAFDSPEVVVEVEAP